MQATSFSGEYFMLQNMTTAERALYPHFPVAGWPPSRQLPQQVWGIQDLRSWLQSLCTLCHTAPYLFSQCLRITHTHARSTHMHMCTCTHATGSLHSTKASDYDGASCSEEAGLSHSGAWAQSLRSMDSKQLTSPDMSSSSFPPALTRYFMISGLTLS